MTDAPKRIQLRRTRGWRKPEGAIVVARPSKWGNPWAVGQAVDRAITGSMTGPGAGDFDPNDIRYFDHQVSGLLTAAEAVELYRDDLLSSLGDEHPDYDFLRDGLAELRGHDLCCWCPLDQPCHADVLLELSNS